MASESDIRRMLIEALRPSLLEVIQQELTPLAELKAAVAQSEATFQQRIDHLSAELSAVVADRIDLACKDLQRLFDQEIDVRMASLKSQLGLNQAAVNALGDEHRRAVARAAERADRIDERLAAAAAALRDPAGEPAVLAEGRRHPVDAFEVAPATTVAPAAAEHASAERRREGEKTVAAAGP